jgi:hypothetical protein
MRCGVLFFVLLIMLLAPASRAVARDQSATVQAFGGDMIVGSVKQMPQTWVPLAVRIVEDNKAPRATRIEYRYANAMSIRQEVVTQPGVNLFVLMVPRQAALRDDKTAVVWTTPDGKPLGHTNDVSFNLVTARTAWFQMLAGTSPESIRRLLEPDPTRGVLPERFKPFWIAEAIFLEGRDAILMPASVASTLNDRETTELLKAAKLGTTLVVFADAQPIDNESPMMRAMPARLGELDTLNTTDIFQQPIWVSRRRLTPQPGNEVVTRSIGGFMSSSKPLGLGALVVFDFDYSKANVFRHYDELFPLMPVHTMGLHEDPTSTTFLDEFTRGPTEFDRHQVRWLSWMVLFWPAWVMGFAIGPTVWYARKMRGETPVWTLQVAAGWALVIAMPIVWYLVVTLLPLPKLAIRQVRFEIDGQPVRHEARLRISTGVAGRYRFDAPPSASTTRPATTPSQLPRWWHTDNFSLAAFQSDGSPMIFDQGLQGNTPTSVLLQRQQIYGLRGVWQPTDPAMLKTDLRLGNKQITGTLTNTSEFAFTDVKLHIEDQVVHVGTISAGATFTLPPTSIELTGRYLLGIPDSPKSLNFARKTNANGSLLDVDEPIAPRVLVRVVANVQDMPESTGLSFDFPNRPTRMSVETRLVAIASPKLN